MGNQRSRQLLYHKLCLPVGQGATLVSAVQVALIWPSRQRRCAKSVRSIRLGHRAEVEGQNDGMKHKDRQGLNPPRHSAGAPRLTGASEAAAKERASRSPPRRTSAARAGTFDTPSVNITSLFRTCFVRLGN
ncbi:hypothetical protein JRQ81_007018 [Phrynocephalus forsythii]|uniref:Uncharacterized protein n=1 Tax=Phrynocephalus forsythii TaxID=171643 RepID=A0A9Q0Y4T1_9SAUR|nr:hypothetical protein JRQ81_007018 [Phrynocephalus forsythii]